MKSPPGGAGGPPSPTQGSRAWGSNGARVPGRGGHLSESHRAEAGGEKETSRSRMAEPGGKQSQNWRKQLAGFSSGGGWSGSEARITWGRGAECKGLDLNTGVHFVDKERGDKGPKTGRVKIQDLEKYASKDGLCVGPRTDSAVCHPGKMEKDKIPSQALKAVSNLKTSESQGLQTPGT